MPAKRRPAAEDSTNDIQPIILGTAFDLSEAPLPLPSSSSSVQQPSTPRKRTAPRKVASPSKSAASRTPQRRRRKKYEDGIESGHGNGGNGSDSGIIRNSDKSARRKSARRVIERVVSGHLSDDEVDEEDLLAQQIYSQLGINNEDENEEEEEVTEDEGGIVAAPTSTRKRKVLTQISAYVQPPLEGYKSYFDQNRKGTKTSHNTLANLPPLDHSEYFHILREHPLDHELERENLLEIHRDHFGQWAFELSQGFNLMLYGYGSKRSLLMEFAKKIHTPKNPVIVINGYVPTLTAKEILSLIFTVIFGASHRQKLGSTPNEMLENLLFILDGQFEPSENAELPIPIPFATLTLLVHNLDGEPLRPERTQSLLSRLCSHSNVRLVASCDHISAPLLWDAARISQYNFLWHDCTTFLPYSIEAPIDDGLQIGTSGRAGGTKGVKYVLASLPLNARELYRILVSHQLQAIIEDGDAAKQSGELYGMEYKVLYQKAVEEFICSNDMSFRTLLKEFHDHQMITSRKDVQGTEMLWAPFRREELESILENIMLTS